MEETIEIKLLLSGLSSKIGQYAGTEQELFTVTRPILSRLVRLALQSYENSRVIIQNMLGLMCRAETEYTVYFSLLINDKYEKKFKTLEIDDKTDSIWQDYIHVKHDDEKAGNLMLESVKKIGSNKIAVGKYYENVPRSFSKEERRVIVASIFDFIQGMGKSTSWDTSLMQSMLMMLAVLRSISKYDNIHILFYFATSNIISRMITSGYPQDSRDIAESALMTSYEDENLAIGYLTMSHCYVANHNVLGALLYFDMMLETISYSDSISRKELKDIVWTLLKIIRESHIAIPQQLKSLCEDFNKLAPNDYDYISFYYTYFTCLLYSGKRELPLPSMVEDFINANREKIFKAAEHSAMPWIALIDSLEQVYEENISQSLKIYKNSFIDIARNNGGNEDLLDLFQNKNLSSHLKEILSRLERTRDLLDYSKDNEVALLFAKRLITQSVKDNKAEDFILAMRSKCDFTFIKQEVSLQSITKPFITENHEVVQGDAPYTKLSNLSILSCVDDNDALVWIGSGIDGVYMMTVIRQMYNFSKLADWEGSLPDFNKDPFIFKSSTKTAGQSIYYKDEADYEAETNTFKELFKGRCISLPSFASRTLLCLEMKNADVPVNLIIDERTGKFLGELVPTANIISTELLVTTNLNKNLHKNFTKSFWLPEDSGDLLFSIIRNKVEGILSSYNISLSTTSELDEPISADLNIICAHGNLQTSQNEILYASGNRFTNIDKIVGHGKVLILLSCFTGAVTLSIYDNAMHTIAKHFIREGYDSVIAPAWALSADIIPIWLSAFMEKFSEGDLIVDALFKANMAVKSRYPVPSAWANMHLLGNPFTRVMRD